MIAVTPINQVENLTGQFLSQLAVDSRLWFAFRHYTFYYPVSMLVILYANLEQNPWVMNQIRLHDGAWRQENIIYNLGIGYPF
jgi:hypothetical protein